MNYDWIRKTNTEKITIKEASGICYLAFPALEQTGLVKHAFSTRIGGVSKPPFDTLNFTTAKGDDPEHVAENYRRMAAVLGVEMERMVLSHQTHTTNVYKVTEADAGKGVVRERDYQDIDGLITDVPGITLVTFYADCVPLYLLDPVHHAIGLSHSGWRGTVNRMGEKTLQAMHQAYGTNPTDVIVAIGPSICQDCFEVGSEVVASFHEHFAPKCWDSLSYEKANGKHQLNLWRANEIIFQEAGVIPTNIHTTDICTHCNPEMLFSHRVMGEQRGNLAAFLSLI